MVLENSCSKRCVNLTGPAHEFPDKMGQLKPTNITKP